MIRASSVRFFLVVSPSPVWMRVAFAAAAAVGAITLWLNPADVDSAFGSILLLQMFSASSGYAAAAARGHFDPLLVSGRSHRGMAIASLIAAALPGVVAWLVIVMVSTTVGGAGAALAPHRHVALILVSVGSWAAGLALPRMSAGALWSLLLVTLALSRGTVGTYLGVVRSVPAGLLQSLEAAATFAFCPFLLLGDFAAAANATVLGVDLVATAVVFCAGTRFIGRREYGLVEPV